MAKKKLLAESLCVVVYDNKRLLTARKQFCKESGTRKEVINRADEKREENDEQNVKENVDKTPC